MKVYEIVPQNFYSCSFCRKEFLSDIELVLFFFCSKSCQFRYAYNLVDEKFPTASKEQKFKITKRLCEVCIR